MLWGSILILVGVLGGGLAANGLVWPLLHGILSISGQPSPLPEGSGPVLFVVALVVVPAGAFLAIWGIGTGMRLRQEGRRLRYQRLASLRRAPVLLLRSFADEELRDPRPVDVFQRRYEESLARALRGLGPVVCIGRPGDELGFGGAERVFVSDRHWQDAVRWLMMRSVVVAILVGRSEGLWWEIETALALVERKRLLFCLPHVSRSRGGDSRTAAFVDSWERWNLSRRRYRQMEAERLDRYRELRRRLDPFVGHVLPDSPGRALFLDFLDDGRPRLLTARKPSAWRYALGLANVLIDALPTPLGRLRFDLARTLQPFVAKLHRNTPGW